MLVKPVSPSQKMLLNCDMGEGLGLMDNDEILMPWIDLASIACGFHAGDTGTMTYTVKLARQHHTRIGAHPGYADAANFGRRSLDCSTEDIINLMHTQLDSLQRICLAQGAQLSYVKPHGALYNDMMRDDAIFKAILQAIGECDSSLPLMVLATADNDRYRSLATDYQIDLLFEAFADRAYDDHGMLVSRALPNAVFNDAQQIFEQAMMLAREGNVISQHGKRLHLPADTLCLHGDNPASVQTIQRLRTALDNFYGAV